jgi:hypothetical protein
MKKLLLTYVIALTYFGLCSTVMADLTPPQTGSTITGSTGTYVVKHGEDSDFDWLYSLLDDVFGWEHHSRDSRYYYYSHDDLGFDSGDDTCSFDSGNGGCDNDLGADAWSFGSGDGGCGIDYTDTGPPRPTPAPGAFVLGSVGLAFAGWLGKRNKSVA